MNRHFVPAAVFGLLCVGFLAAVGASAAALPGKVASHFDLAGQADGWMPRNNYLLFSAIMGLAIPLFVVGLCYVTRFLPDWMINLPNKDYWLSPERREQTNAFLFRHSLWLGCLVLAHFAGMHMLTVIANGRNPPSMPLMGLLAATGIFFCLLGFWIVVLVRRFRRPA